MDIAPELGGSKIEATVVDLSSRYPIVKSWLLGVRIDDAAPAPVTVPATRMIHIPTSWRKRLEDQCKNGVSEITAHEFAHALMLASQLEASEGDLTRLPAFSLNDLLTWNARPSDERSSYLYEPPNAIGAFVKQVMREGVSRKGFGEAHLATYGSQDHLEFFAEAMRAYWTHEPTDGPISPIVVRIGQEIDRLYLTTRS